MKKKDLNRLIPLEEKYPPSEPCSCDVCRHFCRRPGLWTVEEASRAMDAGYGNKMMLEVSPELSLGVLSPAFKGCEGDFALQCFAAYGCTFYINNLCKLFETGFQPLECRFCHHDHKGQGQKCRSDIEKDWNTSAGKALVARWVQNVKHPAY